MKRVLAIALPAAALVGAAVWMWSSPTPPPADAYRVPKHVVIVSIDTLRADHLGAYGHPRARTPFLDELAGQGVVFEQHISAAPTTLASHTTMFTGNHAHKHGAAKNDYVVNDDNLMLQEVFRDAGFSTAAFIGAIPIASHSNFTQGFELIDEHFTLHRNGDGVAQTMRDGKDVTNAVLAWIGGRTDDRPVFLFAHYFDVHSPYRPPEPWRSWYHPDPSIPNAGSMRHINDTRKLLNRNDPDAERHSNTLKELYLGGVSYADHQVGRLLVGLQDAGILDDALIVITSDHGETFDTHSEKWDHGYSVYDETVHTPLIVRLPGGWRGGTRIAEQVSSTDLFPTLLSLIGVDVPETDGTSWLPGLLGEPMPPRGPAFSEATKPGSLHSHRWKNDVMQKSVRQEGYKYILTPRKKRTELYELAGDPGELTDLLAATPPTEVGRGERMGALLEAWREEADPLPSEQLSSERGRMELAALGYVDELQDDDKPQDTDGD